MGYPVDLDYTYLVEPFGTSAGRSFPHTGDDFARKKTNGKPLQEQPDILAAFSGTVIAAGWHAQAGNRTVIRYWFGRIGVYAHQAKLLVRAGQNVTEGQKIGLLGGTGKVTGPHLHYSQYTSEARALSGIVQYWQGVKWASVDAWAAASGLVRPIYKTKDSAASGGSEDAMDAKQYEEFKSLLTTVERRTLKAENDHSNQAQLLGSIRGAATALENGIDWLKKRLGGSVLSDASITASLNDMDQKQLRALADEVGRRINNG